MNHPAAARAPRCCRDTLRARVSANSRTKTEPKQNHKKQRLTRCASQTCTPSCPPPCGRRPWARTPRCSALRSPQPVRNTDVRQRRNARCDGGGARCASAQKRKRVRVRGWVVYIATCSTNDGSCSRGGAGCFLAAAATATGRAASLPTCCQMPVEGAAGAGAKAAVRSMLWLPCNAMNERCRMSHCC